MKDYIDKCIFSKLWPKILDDWRSISIFLKARYGKINRDTIMDLKIID
ncbi:MAG: hypothetical protein QW612_03910 [Candidatus Bathyarchaeia archaeon]